MSHFAGCKFDARCHRFRVDIFASQSKRSGVLLRSNPVRNRPCDMTTSPWSLPSFRVRSCRYDMLDCPTMPKKTTDESLSSGFTHSAVAVQVLLQVGEHVLYLVVRVGLSPCNPSLGR